MGMNYDDGNVDIVILGGVNKKTGKKNPMELLGYFMRVDEIKTKFGTKPLYVFQTKAGVQGVIGSGNLNKIMATKMPGYLTHIIDTGETRDVGKGNPMKVFKVGQDTSDYQDVGNYTATPITQPYSEETTETDAEEAYSAADDEEPAPTYTKPTAPRATPTVTTAKFSQFLDKHKNPAKVS